MEKILMDAGLISLTVLAFVGIIKLPFKKLKVKHPKTFKALFTTINFACIIGAVTLNQIYIAEVPLFTYNTLLLLLAVTTGVFVTYNGFYEGFSIKKLFASLAENVKKIVSKKPENKLVKLAKKIGIESALELVNDLKKDAPETDNVQVIRE